MMKLLLVALLSATASAWSSEKSFMRAAADRRAFLAGLTSAVGVASVAAPSQAMSPFLSDYVLGDLDNEVITSQMAPPGKIDLNSASVSDYKNFQGMFPHAAGKLASHGPYKNVKEIYKIEGLTSRDKELFGMHSQNFVALPPGRQFIERLNGRQSL
eukprot:CAMPEP_0172614750 /NCGR_PEP_ID=MMETSP1068-20121228/54964_1 /TAXON_ID=35684 /ORGANISM="Pseudopedinella elastica, Strain CCMP716" /LENGTH=156 /DNA_ID=CAMNT_0013419659 /DNA_START=14 /DNA_END=484 /DNA_ORIENTATION=+